MSALKLPAPFFTELPHRLIAEETEEALVYPIEFDETHDGFVVVQFIYPDGTIIDNKAIPYSAFPEYTKNNVEKLPDRFIIDVEGRARMFTPVIRKQTGELVGYYKVNGKTTFIELPLEISLEHKEEEEEEGDEDDITIIDPIPLKRRRNQDKVNIPGDMYKSYLAAPNRFATPGEIAMRTKVLKKHLTDPKTKDDLYKTLKKASPTGYTVVETLQNDNWDKYTLGTRETQRWCIILNKFHANLSFDLTPEKNIGRNQITWVLGAAPLDETLIKVMDRVILMVSVNVDVLEDDELEKMQEDYLHNNGSTDMNHRIVCIIDYYQGKPAVIQWIDSATFIKNSQQLLMCIAGGYVFDRGVKFLTYLPQNLKALGLTTWANYLQMCMRRKNIPIPEKKYIGTYTYLTDLKPIQYQQGTYYGYGMCSLFAAWFSFYILFNYQPTYHSLPLLPLHNPREFLVFMWNTILAGELTWDTIPAMIKRVVFADKIKEYGSALLLGDDGEYSEVDDPDSDVYKKFGEGMKKRKRGRFEKGSRAAKRYMAYLRSLRRT